MLRPSLKRKAESEDPVSDGCNLVRKFPKAKDLLTPWPQTSDDWVTIVCRTGPLESAYALVELDARLDRKEHFACLYEDEKGIVPRFLETRVDCRPTLVRWILLGLSMAPTDRAKSLMERFLYSEEVLRAIQNHSECWSLLVECLSSLHVRPSVSTVAGAYILRWENACRKFSVSLSDSANLNLTHVIHGRCVWEYMVFLAKEQTDMTIRDVLNASVLRELVQSELPVLAKSECIFAVLQHDLDHVLPNPGEEDLDDAFLERLNDTTRVIQTIVDNSPLAALICAESKKHTDIQWAKPILDHLLDNPFLADPLCKATDTRQAWCCYVQSHPTVDMKRVPDIETYTIMWSYFLDTKSSEEIIGLWDDMTKHHAEIAANIIRELGLKSLHVPTQTHGQLVRHINKITKWAVETHLLFPVRMHPSNGMRLDKVYMPKTSMCLFLPSWAWDNKQPLPLCAEQFPAFTRKCIQLMNDTDLERKLIVSGLRSVLDANGPMMDKHRKPASLYHGCSKAIHSIVQQRVFCHALQDLVVNRTFTTDVKTLDVLNQVCDTVIFALSTA